MDYCGKLTACITLPSPIYLDSIRSAANEYSMIMSVYNIGAYNNNNNKKNNNNNNISPANCYSNVAVECHNPHNKYQLVLSLKTWLSVQSVFYPKQKRATRPTYFPNIMLPR